MAKASAKKTTAKSASSDRQRNEIARLAYQFYIERGRADGHHEEDWLRAETIVRSRSAS